MFSSRFHWDVTANHLTRALAVKRAAGVRILDLTESNPTHTGLLTFSTAIFNFIIKLVYCSILKSKCDNCS